MRYTRPTIRLPAPRIRRDCAALGELAGLVFVLDALFFFEKARRVFFLNIFSVSYIVRSFSPLQTTRWTENAISKSPAKGRDRVVRFDLASQRPTDEELLQLLLGRSGKLRAPALRYGTRLVVGYNQALPPLALG